MNRIYLLGAACGLGVATAAEFEKPVKVQAGEETIKVESPGYAAPCLADINKDGKKDLLVGQFNKGKIKVYPGKGKGTFGAGVWLKTGKHVAEVPGVW